MAFLLPKQCVFIQKHILVTLCNILNGCIGHIWSSNRCLGIGLLLLLKRCSNATKCLSFFSFLAKHVLLSNTLKVLQICPFQGPGLLFNNTGDIYCVYFYVWGSLHVFALKQGILGYKYKHFTANALFFQIKTCGFHLLKEGRSWWRPALAVW